MRNTLFLLFLLPLFQFSSCRKPRPSPVEQLPPATQEGKNTLGFLLNGQPWTPQGFNGTANLSIDVDFGFKQGIFGISAYRTNSGEHVGLGIRDSLNFTSIPSSIRLEQNSLYQCGISTKNCFFDYYDTTVLRSGSLTISKLDKSKRIIAGTFTATLSKPGCETITITDGRFDMKY